MLNEFSASGGVFFMQEQAFDIKKIISPKVYKIVLYKLSFLGQKESDIWIILITKLTF